MQNMIRTYVFIFNLTIYIQYLNDVSFDTLLRSPPVDMFSKMKTFCKVQYAIEFNVLKCQGHLLVQLSVGA